MRPHHNRSAAKIAMHHSENRLVGGITTRKETVQRARAVDTSVLSCDLVRRKRGVYSVPSARRHPSDCRLRAPVVHIP